jgi:hypothetical protein
VKILQPETGGNRKNLNNYDLHNLFFSQNIISVMRWVEEAGNEMHTEL